MKQVLMVLALGLVTGNPFLGHAAEVSPSLLERTIAGAKTFMSLSDDVKVSYDSEAEHLHIAFTTPENYTESEEDRFERWRHNQWVFLQEFRLSKIPVKWVSIETNLVNGEGLGEGLLRYTHKAVHVDKYADLYSDSLWLRTGKASRKKPDSKQWEALD